MAKTQVELTEEVKGLLPVAHGGSGAGTLTGLLVGNGTSAFTTVTAPAGTVVGTTDTQTETNKTLSDTFMGQAFEQRLMQRSVTLTASQDFMSVDALEIPAANTLEIPATSTLEILYYVTPVSADILSNKTLGGTTSLTGNLVPTPGSIYTLGTGFNYFADSYIV